VFDFYNVLTSNGGDADTNDLNQTTGNHHRWRDNTVQHTQTLARNTSAYPTGDSHPSMAGNLKATAEFVPLLNHFYSLFSAPAHTSCAPGPVLISDTAYSDSWRVGSETTLSTAGTVTVAAGANVTFEAADAIALNAGFSVQSGGLFASRLGAVVCN